MKTCLVIFGITGDLGRRKLLPALFNVAKSGQTDELEIIGVSRRKISKEKILERFADEKFSDVDKFAKAFRTVKIDPANPQDFAKLKFAKNTRPIFYLSVPPDATNQIVKGLAAAKLNTPDSRIMFEKPFGRDEKSARKLFANTEKIFAENQIYRIDHYLEKDMAQNLVVFRGSNAMFSQLWHGYFIERIDIIASEKIGIEGRGDFYEQTGAMRDVIQGHLLQLAALTLMKIPLDFSWNKLAEYKLAALRQIQPISIDTYRDALIRGQYDGYLSDAGREKSSTETFANLAICSTDPDWRGVPIRLIAGKKLAEKFTEIRVYFRRSYATQDNLLRIRLDSNSVDVGLRTKIIGYDRQFETIDMTLPGGEAPEAYEQVLIDAIRGDRSLFLSREEILESWRVVDAAFRQKTVLREYKSGADFEKNLTI